MSIVLLHVLFDIDGTMLRTGGGGVALRDMIVDEFDRPHACTRIDYAGRTDRAILSELLHRNGLADTAANRSRLWRRYVDHLPGVLRRGGGGLIPGVVETLDALSADGRLVLGVLTGNTGQSARIKLRHFGLLAYFAHIFGGDHDADRRDLAKRARSTLREKYGDRGCRIVVVGDTPADVQCARAIDAPVVAVATGGHSRGELESHRPDLSLNDLTELKELRRFLDSLLDSGSVARRDVKGPEAG